LVPSNDSWEVLVQAVNSELVIESVEHRVFDEAQVAAVAFLACYNGRTLEAYRQDLRGFMSWADTVGLPALAATRGQIELYSQHMEQRVLAASTIDRRLSTPARYVRRPKVPRGSRS
jgi:Phage integrase, N-terminal SAM-like domain